MDISTKIKIAMTATKTTQTQLAYCTNQKQSTLSEKLSKNNFRINDLETLVKALGCDLEVNIILPDGKRI